MTDLEHKLLLYKTWREKSKIKERINQYKIENNIQVNCVSDQTLLHIRYILDRLEKEDNKKLDEAFKHLVDQIYRETRGNNFEIGVNTPSTLASAVISFAAHIYSTKIRKKIIISQKDIGDITGIKGGRTITIAKRKLEIFFNKHNITFTMENKNNYDTILP